MYVLSHQSVYLNISIKFIVDIYPKFRRINLILAHMSPYITMKILRSCVVLPLVALRFSYHNRPTLCLLHSETKTRFNTFQRKNQVVAVVLSAVRLKF